MSQLQEEEEEEPKVSFLCLPVAGFSSEFFLFFLGFDALGTGRDTAGGDSCR